MGGGGGGCWVSGGDRWRTGEEEEERGKDWASVSETETLLREWKGSNFFSP